ncbi:MAG: AAA family ATPase [Treponema sp.]|nr:AAA family ATPase [Treponema sp.]
MALVMQHEVSIAIEGKVRIVCDLQAERYRPYAKIGDCSFYYDPATGYRPVNAPPRVKKLYHRYAEIATGLLDLALKNYMDIKDEAERAQQRIEAHTQTIEEEEPMKQEQLFKADDPDMKIMPGTTSLESYIVHCVKKEAVDQVVNVTKPMIDSYIRDTYGTLPKRIEIKTEKETKVIEGVAHHKFETVLKLVNANVPVFLSGPAGSGKNVICKQVSEALNMEFYFSNAITQEYKLTGFIDANGRFHETQFYKAFTNGGLFMLDEIDASTPEVLVILNAAIANGYFDFPTGKVTAHEDFRICAAGNTFGSGADITYTGRYQLDASSLDRFAIVEIDYDEAIETAIACGNTELVKFVRDFREACNKQHLKFIVSYRAIERLHKLENVFAHAEAIKIVLLKGLEHHDARIVYDNLKTEDSAYTKGFKQALSEMGREVA